jgi:hypothetical protein
LRISDCEFLLKPLCQTPLNFELRIFIEAALTNLAEQTILLARQKISITTNRNRRYGFGKVDLAIFGRNIIST